MKGICNYIYSKALILLALILTVGAYVIVFLFVTLYHLVLLEFRLIIGSWKHMFSKKFMVESFNEVLTLLLHGRQ